MSQRMHVESLNQHRRLARVFNQSFI